MRKMKDDVETRKAAVKCKGRGEGVMWREKDSHEKHESMRKQEQIRGRAWNERTEPPTKTRETVPTQNQKSRTGAGKW